MFTIWTGHKKSRNIFEFTAAGDDFAEDCENDGEPSTNFKKNFYFRIRILQSRWIEETLYVELIRV